MPIYLKSLVATTCTSKGCLCHDRQPTYPTDLSDAEWEVLRPQAEAVMAELCRAQGRPMVHNLRAVLDAIAYTVDNGIKHRALPADFPPWEAVVAFSQRWRQRGLSRQLVARLRERVRVGLGRNAEPTAAIIDSQSVKAAETVGKDSRGYDGNKKINGRKRHLAVDTEGLLLAVVVTAASIADRAGAKLLLIALLNMFTTLKLIWADSGYSGPKLATWFASVGHLTLEVVKRTELHCFRIVPRRWVVERTFGWLMRSRRLVRDYERHPATHEDMIYWATVFLLTRRLARMAGAEPKHQPRWGQPRTTPTAQPVTA